MSQNPIVTFTVAGRGTIKAELYPEAAPNTVNNFISLVNKGFYDGLIFHRIISGFREDVLRVRAWVVRVIQSRVSFHRTALRTT